jgi:hypothetical protein
VVDLFISIIGGCLANKKEIKQIEKNIADADTSTL